MPNTINSTRSNKVAGGGFGGNTAPSSLPALSSAAYSVPNSDQPHSAAGAERATSASSSDSSPDQEAAFNLLQEIAPNMPADQHALNDLGELHSRAASAMSGAGNVAPAVGLASARQAPSRTSSWSSSRGVSALSRSDSKAAAENDGNQLALQGLAIL